MEGSDMYRLTTKRVPLWLAASALLTSAAAVSFMPLAHAEPANFPVAATICAAADPTAAATVAIPLGYKRIIGTTGNDAFHKALHGTSANEVIWGFAGNDHINGGGGSDIICAGTGKDTIKGGGGSDYIHALDGGVDTIRGGGGGDFIYADADDKVKGGSGDDFLCDATDNCLPEAP
jgi:Ca2+-binding RTX toxin-like protein